MRALAIEQRPELDEKGRVVLVPKPGGKPYRFRDARKVNTDERATWTRLYADGLRNSADQAEGQLEAQQRREALQKVAKQTQIRG